MNRLKTYVKIVNTLRKGERRAEEEKEQRFHYFVGKLFDKKFSFRMEKLRELVFSPVRTQLLGFCRN